MRWRWIFGAALLFSAVALGVAIAGVGSFTITGPIGGGAGSQYMGPEIGITGANQLGGGTPPPVCSNALDFSQSCNSQYLVMRRF
jgi:hypothetical protein